jgi:hypothetical protein
MIDPALHRLNCGCGYRAFACRCSVQPHAPHNILVSPCGSVHAYRVGRLVVMLPEEQKKETEHERE